MNLDPAVVFGMLGSAFFILVALNNYRKSHNRHLEDEVWTLLTLAPAKDFWRASYCVTCPHCSYEVYTSRSILRKGYWNMGKDEPDKLGKDYNEALELANRINRST